MVALQTEDLFFLRLPQSLQKMVAFCTEDFFFEIAPRVKPMSPQNSVLATCQNIMATIFKNDIIFAMKSQGVQILYITLLFETES